MVTRLTDEQRRDRATSEADLQRLVCDLAAYLGWSWVHFRPAQTRRGWRVPVEGPLGEGWPDLILVRPRDGRVLAVELKRELAKPTAYQVAVLTALSAGGLEIALWRPSDLASGAVEATLRDRQPATTLADYDYETEGLGGT